MKNNLGWEYCECGCHGCMLTAGGQTFWRSASFLEEDARKAMYEVTLGHRRGPLIGYFNSTEEIDREIVKRLTETLQEIQATIQALEPDVGEGI